MSNCSTPSELRQQFLELLRGGATIIQAAEEVGIGLSTLYRHRDKDAAFQAAWQAADDEGTRAFVDALCHPGVAPPPRRRRKVNSPEARARLLEALCGGASDVQAAAAIGINSETAYRWRAADPAFAAQWREARAAGVRLILGTFGRPKEVEPPADRRRRSMKSAEAKARCLERLSDGGALWYVAYAGGVDSSTVRRWRREDPEFEAAWAVAYRAGSLALLEAAKRRWARQRIAEKRALGLLPPLETAAPRRP